MHRIVLDVILTRILIRFGLEDSVGTWLVNLGLVDKTWYLI